MEESAAIHVGLDIGTSKICVVVGEVRPRCTIKILGTSLTETKGVVQGEIFNSEQTIECLKEAIKKAEVASGIQIGSVFLALNGAHIQGTIHCANYVLPDDDPIVTSERIEEACSLARDCPIPEENVDIHPIVRNYRLDGNDHEELPLNASGKVIEVDYYVVHGNLQRIQSSIDLVKEIGLEIDEIVFSPIAAAQVVLGRSHRDLGALVIDIGGGTTDYLLYLNGAIAGSGCIPIGGDHVTNAIHHVTGLPTSIAERLKVTEGDAYADPSASAGMAKFSDAHGEENEVHRVILNETIRQRLKETLKAVRAQLPAGALESLGAGVFLTGGTSRQRGLRELAADVFGCEVHPPVTPSFSGVRASFDGPEYATALGLIRYAQIIGLIVR